MRPWMPLLALVLVSVGTGACDTNLYKFDPAGAAPVDAAVDATFDAAPAFDGGADGAGDGAAVVDGAAPDAADGSVDGAPDGSLPATVATATLPATTSYQRSQFQMGTSPADPSCIAPPLGGNSSGATILCCFVPTTQVFPNEARIALHAGGLVCLEAGAASACAPLGAGAPGVANAQIAEGNGDRLTAVAKAWGMIFAGNHPGALALDASSTVTVTPAADGTHAEAVFQLRTSYGAPPGCERGVGSWMDATIDVPLVAAP